GAARGGVEAALEVHLDLARKARERLELQEVAVLGGRIDRAGEAEVELAVGVGDPLAREPRRLVDDPQGGTAPMRAPVLVEELPQHERIVAELELGDTLGHGVL